MYRNNEAHHQRQSSAVSCTKSSNGACYVGLTLLSMLSDLFMFQRESGVKIFGEQKNQVENQIGNMIGCIEYRVTFFLDLCKFC